MNEDDNQGAMQGETFAVLMALLMLLLCIAKFETADNEKAEMPKVETPKRAVEPLKWDFSKKYNPEKTKSEESKDTTPLTNRINDLEAALAGSQREAQAKETQLLGLRIEVKRMQDQLNQNALESKAVDHPPVIPIPGSSLFETGKFAVTDNGKVLLSTMAKNILEQSRSSGCDVLEVFGHTDGQGYKKERGEIFSPDIQRFRVDNISFLDFDRVLHEAMSTVHLVEQPEYIQRYVYNGREFRAVEHKQYWALSNVELGMARAAAVAVVLKFYLDHHEANRIRSVRVYSAGQFELPNGNLSEPGDTKDSPSRRRVVLRLTKDN